MAAGNQCSSHKERLCGALTRAELGHLHILQDPGDDLVMASAINIKKALRPSNVK